MSARFRRFPHLIAAVALLLAGCGGGGGGGSSTSSVPIPTGDCNAAATAPSVASNQTLISVAQNPAVATSSNPYTTVNLPFVSVTLCDGNQHCQTIDHVVVDTGSYGLRVLHSVLQPQLALNPSTSGAGTLAECASFLSGYMWGGVFSATVQIGGETTTRAIPVEIIDDDNALTLPPAPVSCSNGGTNIGTLNGIGGNGLLGLGLFVADEGTYYSCSGANCSLMSVSPPASSQVSNPVAFFYADNNGAILQMPAISGMGCPSATGTLTFGINTQANNNLQGYSVMPADGYGDFTATYNGMPSPSSYLDSGSNYNFLVIPGMGTDGQGDYTPPQYTLLSPVMLTSNVLTAPSSIQTSIGVISPYAINSTYTAINDIAGMGNSGAIDFGMPFFYGKSIAFLLNGASVAQGSGPLYALH